MISIFKSKLTEKTTKDHNYDCRNNEIKDLLANLKPQQPQRRVFRLNRNFQATRLHETSSNKRQSNILQQRRSNRANYFENIKKEIFKNNKNVKTNDNHNHNILHHDDFFSDDDDEITKNSCNKPKKRDIDYVKSRQNRLNHLQNKLLQKKIITKHQNCNKTRS